MRRRLRMLLLVAPNSSVTRSHFWHFRVLTFNLLPGIWILFLTVVSNSTDRLALWSKQGFINSDSWPKSSPIYLERVIHAFNCICPNYCTSLFAGLGHSAIWSLQLVQNAAGRHLTGAKMWEHIAPVLSCPHWLPVPFFFFFFLFELILRCYCTPPPNLSELLSIHAPLRALRSSNQMILDVPKTRPFWF